MFFFTPPPLVFSPLFDNSPPCPITPEDVGFFFPFFAPKVFDCRSSIYLFFFQIVGVGRAPTSNNDKFSSPQPSRPLSWCIVFPQPPHSIGPTTAFHRDPFPPVRNFFFLGGGFDKSFFSKPYVSVSSLSPPLDPLNTDLNLFVLFPPFCWQLPSPLPPSFFFNKCVFSFIV